MSGSGDDDEGRMEYDDFIWDPSEEGEGGRPRRRAPDQPQTPWHQPFSWDTPQSEEARDPFGDTGPLDPYPPIGGAGQAHGGHPPADRDLGRFWQPQPPPAPEPPAPAPPPGAGDTGSLNGHGNGHGGYDDTDASGRYADFTEALIERLADGVADPHTDPRMPRQPPPPPPAAHEPRDRQGPPPSGPVGDGPPVAAVRRQPPPLFPPRPDPEQAPGWPPDRAPDWETHRAPEPPVGEPEAASAPEAQRQPEPAPSAPPFPEPFPEPFSEPFPEAGAADPESAIPSRASRHQGRGRPAARLPKPSMPTMPRRSRPSRQPHRPSTPGPSAPGIRPGIRRRPMPVQLPGELSGLARSSLALMAVLVVVAAGFGGVTSVLPRPKSLAAPATLDPYSQRWVCPLLPQQSATVAVANIGSAPATVHTATRMGDDPTATQATSQLAAGQTTFLKANTTNRPGLVQVEAFNAPVVVSATGQPACMPGPTDHAWLPIVDLSGDATTSVVIANPDAEDAVVDLVPHLANGSIVNSTQEIFVPHRSTKTTKVGVGDNLGPGLQFSVEVVARSGRVVTGAVITRKAQPPTFVPGPSTPRSSWSFAGGLTGNGHQTSLLLANPSSKPLQVSARIISDKGAFNLPGSALDKPVPGGAMAQIPISTSATSAAGAFGVEVQSRDGTRFIAALRVSTVLGSAQQIGYVDPGSALPDRSWLVPGAGGGQVVLVNTSTSAVNAQLIPVGQPAGQTANQGKSTAGKSATAAAPATVSLTLPPGRVVVRNIAAQVGALDVEAGEPGVLVAQLGSGSAIPSALVGGVPAGGPVVQGPAAG